MTRSSADMDHIRRRTKKRNAVEIAPMYAGRRFAMASLTPLFYAHPYLLDHLAEATAVPVPFLRVVQLMRPGSAMIDGSAVVSAFR